MIATTVTGRSRMKDVETGEVAALATAEGLLPWRAVTRLAL